MDLKADGSFITLVGDRPAFWEGLSQSGLSEVK